MTKNLGPISNPANGTATLEVNPAGENKRRYSSTSSTAGDFFVTWGGADDGSVVSFALGSLDFLIYDAFEMDLAFSDQPFDLSIRFANDGLGTLSADLPVPVKNPEGLMTLGLSLTPANFGGVTQALFDAIMGDVDAVKLVGRGAGNRGLDADFSAVRLVGASEAPLPGAAGLLLGAVGLGALRLRRRAA